MAAALLAAPACITLDDLSMPEDAGEDAATEDAQQVEVDPDEPDLPDESDTGDAQVGADANLSGDASQPMMDGGQDAAPPDTGIVDPLEASIQMRPPQDAFVPPPRCTSNESCKSDEFCGPGGAACLPKCNADGACMVYEVPAHRHVAQFASDDQALYFSYYGEVGPGVAGEIWRREPGQAPTMVTDQAGQSGDFVVRDGYVYFHRGPRFFRAKVTPQAPTQELYVVPGAQDVPWTVGNGFLVVSVHDGFWFGSLDGSQALRKIESELVGTPPQVLSSGDRFYFPVTTKVNDYELTRLKSVRMVEPYAIENASPILQVPNLEGVLREVRPPYAYFGWQSPERIDLGNGEVEELSQPLPGHSPDSRYYIKGNWLYTYNAGYEIDAGPRIDRYFLGAPSISQQILPPRPDGELAAAGMIMAVVGKRFYTVERDRIYEKTLPPAPCEGQAQCEADEICGPEAVCMPKCQGDGSCVVFQAARGIASVHTYADSVFVVLGPTADGAGNPKADAELWQVLPQDQSRRVASAIGDPYSVALNGGYAYFRRGKSIYRVSLQPGSTEQLLYTVSGNIPDMSWVVGDNFLAISTDEGIAFGSLDGGVALREIVDALPADNAPRLLTEGDRLLFAYDARDSAVGARFYSIRMVEPYTTNELTALRGRSEVVWSSNLKEDLLYYWSLPGGIMRRVDVTDGTDYLVGVGYSPPDWDIGEARPVLIGDWVYTHQYFRVTSLLESQVYLGRCSTRSLGTCQAIVTQRDAASTGMSEILGVAGGNLYGARGRLLYELPLPAPPCNAQLPCPTGTTCGTDNLCH